MDKTEVGMTRERRRGRAWLVGGLLVALAQGKARALTDEEIFRDFRFNFLNPGARAVGLGGAFIAAADDATAAQANPAALHYVSRNEVFVEYRVVQPETESFQESTGDIHGTDPANMTFPFLSLSATTEPDDSSVLSFVSFAYPFRLGTKRARLALSRQVVLDVDHTLSPTNNALCFSLEDFPVWGNSQPPCGDSRLGSSGLQQYAVANTVDGNLEAQLVHYNLAFSYSFLRDFSLGVTATYATLDMRSGVTSTASDPRGILFSRHPRLDVDPSPGVSLTSIESQTRIDDTDEAFAYTLGLHWHPDSVFGGLSPVRFGLVYRKGADLSVAEVVEEKDATTGAFVPVGGSPIENVLREPDRLGIGVSFDTPEHHWTFALDAERIQFSDLMKGFRPGVNFFTSGRVPSSFFTIDSLAFDVDDATVIHAGVEFSFQTGGGWDHALRAGYYNAPDNRIHLTNIAISSATAGLAAALEPLYRNVFGAGEDQNHFTVGFSLNTPIDLNFQFAADFADDQKQFVASAIYRFGEGK